MLYAALPLLFPLIGGAIAQSTSSETVRAAVVFSRHGDRTWKGSPPTQLTVLGQNELYNSGSFYRSRYLNSSSPLQIVGIQSEFNYGLTQIYASASDSELLVNSGQAFLQGLFPPSLVSATEQKLANGSSYDTPLNGYQYASIHTISNTDTQTIWLDGEANCPAYTTAGNAFLQSAEYKALQTSTKSFYTSFSGIFAGVLSDSELDYANAYMIFDYANVNSIHNTTVANLVTAEELFQLRILADSHEVAYNANMSSANVDALTIGGRTLVEKIVTQFKSAISSNGTTNIFSLLVGSYDTFLSFFGITGLQQVSDDFYGLPDYASTLVFELFSYANDTTFPDESDLYVRFLFRNGTTDGIAAYPLFGRSESEIVMPWTDFEASMAAVSVSTLTEWCSICSTSGGICPTSSNSSTSSSSTGQVHHRVSPPVAGVIGAMVTLGLSGLALGIAALCGLRFARPRKVERAASALEKHATGSDSSRSV
ncbi:hypothetical protein RUND412_006397 [Rhizina undulata]